MTMAIAQPRKAALRRLGWNSSPVAMLLLFPALFVLAFIILVPSIQLLLLSMTDYSPGLGGGDFVGL